MTKDIRGKNYVNDKLENSQKPRIFQGKIAIRQFRDVTARGAAEGAVSAPPKPLEDRSIPPLVSASCRHAIRRPDGRSASPSGRSSRAIGPAFWSSNFLSAKYIARPAAPA